MKQYGQAHHSWSPSIDIISYLTLRYILTLLTKVSSSAKGKFHSTLQGCYEDY